MSMNKVNRRSFARHKAGARRNRQLLPDSLAVEAEDWEAQNREGIVSGLSDPELQRLLSIFDSVPAGVSIAPDRSCRRILHNPVSAELMRIGAWESLSCSGPQKLAVKFYHKNKELSIEEMPVQRAAWFGEEVNGMEIELVWEDGVRKKAVMNSMPLYSGRGQVIGAIATFNDVTQQRRLEEELIQHRDNLEALVRERTRELEVVNAILIKENMRRKDAEAELAETYREISDILESITDAFYTLDEQWRFTFLNNEALRQFSKTKKQLQGKHIREVLPNATKTIRKFNEVVKNRQAVHYETYSSDLNKWLEIHAYPAKRGISVYFHDVTERKQIQKEMARLDRLYLVGEMAAGIGHEIRNPMTTVRGFLQLLAARQQYSEDRQYFDLMLTELDRANSIITEYLLLAKDKTIRLRVQSLSAIVGTMWPLLKIDAGISDKSIVVELSEVPDLPLDEKEIRQLIVNLVRNGLDASPPGGEVKIRVYSETAGVVLEVQDKGHGIPKDTLDKIGTPFFTTKDFGTGLGLAVCYSIAFRHQAKIEIETSPSGTAVKVRFCQARNNNGETEKFLS